MENRPVRRFPEPISNLVAAFARLPGVGPKTALRYVFYLLQQPKFDLDVMARALTQLGERIQTCSRCYTYTESETCEICLDPKRDPSLLCVVEEARDISTIEATGMYSGFYHVLGGTLNPIEGMTPDTIRLRQLKARLETSPDVKEIILALSPTAHGEATIMFIQKQLASPGRTMTRLARGLPLGATLEFADEVTLTDALKGRKKL
ncbi:recombination protein RecR [Candidatus Uhrbacteria bacterium CG10_big_fil_rev_8_21_14_0_10_48_16]|uniref:Recombination protein RecR n=1 Tax=Candidatus Uhrbacteria bacterium CG10_big_fil_rev_8_21_14_0_10_48_16 TaxID=1975038 RepID=A0A2M8LGF5_9BACT|nr:MAG: recombination protein RecR [Candidatus Uhrbacteria bacterium CG10_big_fil_rev_8_21_14_0_10_48_16]